WNDHDSRSRPTQNQPRDCRSAQRKPARSRRPDGSSGEQWPAEGATPMTPVADSALDALHATANDIFTGAIKACNIDSAFDRRIRFDGNTLHRLLPDGSGPASIDLSCFKKIVVIAMGKVAGPMLDTLLDRMTRRKGLRGICCSNHLPASRSWRFRYFEGGHPLPNEESFAAAR